MEGLELGAEYRSLGRRLERVVREAPSRRDKEGSEVGVARRMGMLRLRLSQSELSDNVDRNPALPRTTKAQTTASAELRSPSWPVLGLSYATGDADRVWLTPSRRNRGTDHQEFDSVAATVYYDGAGWQASAASTYATSGDRAAAERETASLYQDVALTVRLAAALAVTGTATVGAEQDRGSDTRSDTRSAYLTLAYMPPTSRWHAWTQAGHTSRRSTDGAVDGESLTVGGGLGCDLGRVFSGRARVSAEAGYDQYVDRATPTSSAQGLYGFLRLTLPAF